MTIYMRICRPDGTMIWNDRASHVPREGERIEIDVVKATYQAVAVTYRFEGNVETVCVTVARVE